MEFIIPSDQKGRYLYEQIYEYIKKEIKEGKLQKGERLPSSRSLCASLKLSRSTIQLAYEQLEAEGYIEARPYKGYFVLDIAEFSEGCKVESGKELIQEAKTGDDECRIDFSPRGIDFSSFPYGIWRKLARETFRDDNQEMFAAGDRRGEPALREVIADYLYHARGVDADPERIIIGAGNEYLMMLLGMILGKQKLAMENPTYIKAYRLFAGMGWEIESLDMDEQGMRADLLRKSKNGIAYIMPSHQYPTGIVMPVSRRREIVNWAMEEAGRYIIEDDYDSEFRYRGRPIPAMQGMGGENHIIYTGTFSKAIAPAIRVGFMLLPPDLMKMYNEKLTYLSCTVPRPVQNILFRFIGEGYFERHLHKMRKLYKDKQDVLLEELGDFSEKFRVFGVQAGQHLIIESEDEEDMELARRARKFGVKVYPISDFYIKEKHNKKRYQLVIGFASLGIQEIKEGCKLLKKAWGRGEGKR